MTISFSDADATRELLQCLANTSDVTFSVDCITDDESRPCVLTVDDISEKRLEAAKTAVRRGYYEVPREASLADLASELGVSESAVSQKLNAVERKLVRALVEACK